MHPFHRPGRRQRMQTLIMARPMTSLMEKEILLATDAVQPGRDRWVGALVDTGHFVPSRNGRLIAWRAIDRQARLFWLVVSRFEAMQYHASHASAHDALAEAEAAFARRRLARRHRTEIEALCQGLLRFRRHLTVTRDDAVMAGLSPLAIGSFCDRWGFGGSIPGWLAALLIRVEPDIGFALLAAARRQGGSTAPA